MMTTVSADRKLHALQGLIGGFRRVLVAFSGGVDSTFVLKVAVDVLGRQNVLAVTADSPSVPRQGLGEARELARLIGAEHVVIETHELDDPCYASNPPDRCYFCKSDLFSRLTPLASQHGYDAILTGANADDLDDWRPGLRAGEDQGVHNPCAEAHLSKADIRRLSRDLGLPTHDKPASPCLASRVAYGVPISGEVLARIERAEEVLRQFGLREFRVRHHGDLARIEMPPDRIAEFAQPERRARIVDALRKLGYTYVTIDLAGFRSGSLNEAIEQSRAGLQNMGHRYGSAPGGTTGQATRQPTAHPQRGTEARGP